MCDREYTPLPFWCWRGKILFVDRLSRWESLCPWIGLSYVVRILPLLICSNVMRDIQLTDLSNVEGNL